MNSQSIIGDSSPLFYYEKMISDKQVEYLVHDTIQALGLYIVEIKVSVGNRIMVIIDSMKGATIDDCVRVSRAIEGQLDREVEDFELEVSSPGLTEPFKVSQQYQKNIGKEVEVLLKNGQKQKGTMTSFQDNHLTLELQKKVKPEGKKKSEIVIEKIELDINDIKSTKLILNF